MDKRPKLIYKWLKTNKPTEFPSYFYGMADNRVYVVYSSPVNETSGTDEFEYFVALLEDFSYNYEEEILFNRHANEKKPLYLESFVDEYNPKLKVIKKVKTPENIFISDLLVKSLLEGVINQISLSGL